MSTAYLMGIVVGIVFCGAFALLVHLRHKKQHPGADEFDERQLLARGKAFQYGFYTMLTAGGICACVDYVDALPGRSFPWLIGALILGVAVFALTAIHHDAYYGFREKPERYYIMGACLIFVMAFSGISNVTSADPDNVAFGIVNFEVAAIWLVIVAALLIHNRKGREKE